MSLTFQYNKSKGKPHPFEICGNLDWDVIKEKLAKLKDRAATDEAFATALARESGDDAAKIKFGFAGLKASNEAGNFFAALGWPLAMPVLDGFDLLLSFFVQCLLSL